MASICFNPVEVVVREDVDLIEINRFYDEQGKHILDQLIYYDWSSERSRYQVRAWRLYKTPAQVPVYCWSSGCHIARWQDGQVLREVRATTVRHSWTQYDPELVERRYLPKQQRRDLQKRGPTGSGLRQPAAVGDQSTSSN